MKPFHYTQCKSKDVSDIKSARKQQANDNVFLENYSFLLNDTKIAIENIESCLNSETELRGRYILMIGGDLSFADDIMGLNPIGNNNSHYRSYLALDETTVIEVRIGNHYETKKAAKEKSNNKSQYLFQVVVSENEPSVPNGSEPIKNICRVGNLRVLTKKFLSSESSMEDFIEILQSIHDYLILPSKSYEDALSAQTNDAQSTQDATEQNITNNQENKQDKDMKTENRKRNVVRLTESQLKQMVAESVKKVLNEYDDVYGTYGPGYEDTEYNPLYELYNMNAIIPRAIKLLDTDHFDENGDWDDNRADEDFKSLMGWCEKLYYHCKPFCAFVEMYLSEKK